MLLEPIISLKIISEIFIFCNIRLTYNCYYKLLLTKKAKNMQNIFLFCDSSLN